jgi:hypothetical protein
MSATGYVCARCGGPVDALRYDMWCTSCHDDVIAIEDTTAPTLASPEQRAAIRLLYKRHGLHSTEWMLRDLSRRLGREITDLRQVTQAEARTELPRIREWANG